MSKELDYEPAYDDPQRELEACLALYRKMIRRLHHYDDMEVVARLLDRDGLEWALQKLDGQVPQAILDEIAELDERLRAEAEYLVNTLDVYGAIGRDQPKSHWWWYLDELLAQPEEVPAPEQAPVLQRTPTLALHEEAAEYTPPEVPGQASTIPADKDRIE